MSKKYFVVSDIHGFYDKMIDALNEKGFDAHNENHIFVSCGDLLDRGDKPLECLKFVNELPSDRKVLIRGNHEDLMVECIRRGYIKSHDISNGTVATMLNLANSYIDNANDYTLTNFMKEFDPWKKYLSSTIDFFETKSYIFVHGWLPHNVKDIEENGKITFIDKWREASARQWAEARWYNGMNEWAGGNFEEDKTIVCGHYHTSFGHCRLHNNGAEFGKTAIFTPFSDRGILAIDGCTAYSGIVNCVVIEDV